MYIKNLTALDSLVAGDNIAIGASSYGDDRRAALSVLLTWLQDNLTIVDALAFAEYTTQYAAPSATGQNIQVTDADDNIHLIITPAAGYARITSYNVCYTKLLRNNRITVDFVPKDGGDDILADTCDGRYRSDEEDSGAQESYDNAFDEAVLGGFGAWRLKSVYEDEEDDENEYQKICFEPIYDADSSVFFDLAAQRQDKSDASHCFVLRAIPRQTYIDDYGDDPSDS